MAGRSTRNKVKYQADKCVSKLERIQGHLKNIDDLAQDQSGTISATIPSLVAATEALQEFFIAFRNSL